MMTPAAFRPPQADTLLLAALAEDLGLAPESVRGFGPGLLERDVTSSSVLRAGASFRGRFVAREYLVVCGLPYLERVFALLAEAAGVEGPTLEAAVPEGAFLEPGETIARIEGDARLVLAGERTALNLMMTLSGIATEARRWQEEAGESLLVVDTRKTWPGLRALSKYAVRVGGACNHRMGLWDMVLIKDNHIRAAGGIEEAVRRAREQHPDLAIQVEADTPEQAERAAASGADSVLLDNMTDDEVAEATAAVRRVCEGTGRECTVEVSGKVELGRLAALRTLLVDRVSTSAITFARPVDIALDSDE